jgi:hypothetical protein
LCLREGALQLLGGMREAGRPPDVVSYSAAVASCGGAEGAWAQALGLVRDLRRRSVEAPGALGAGHAAGSGPGGAWPSFPCRELRGARGTQF